MTPHKSLSIGQASLLLALLYGLAALVSLSLTRTAGSIATLWYANAIAIAFLMHRPAPQWPWLLAAVGIANALANLAWGDPWVTALRFVPPNLLEIVLAAALIRRAGLDRQSLENPANLLSLVVLGCVVAPAASALLGSVVVAGGLEQSLYATVLPWMASAVVGGASALPLSVMIHREGVGPLRALSTTPLFWGLLTTAVGMTLLVHAYLPYPFVYTVLPLMVSAMTLPMLGTAVITLAVSLTLGLMLAVGAFVPPPTTWAWQQMFVYLALAAALMPAQVLAAARAAGSRTQVHLERSARSLEKANQSLQQFIHMASHDLREPVNTVSQFAGLLQEDHQKHLPATAQAHLQRIGHGAQRMRVLLDDVVQFASLAQQTSIALAPVDLDSCLMAVRQKLGSVVAARGAVISSRTLPVVTGDAVLLETLLTHLLDNALKFVPADRTPVIEIDAQLSKGTAIIRIADNGIGIDPAYADRLFEPFARLTTRRQFNGSGLGLAVCRQIVQMHHGSIGIRPGEGQGAVVDISLPFG